MRGVAFLVLALLLAGPARAADPPRRIVAAGPPANVLLLALAPDRLLGWVRPPTREEADYLPPATRALPEIGRLTGRGGTVNLEVLLASKADLVVDVGSTGRTYRSLAERVQSQTGIRYLLLDGGLEATPSTVRALGREIGAPERAEALAAYAEETFRLLEGIPATGRPTIYLARGPEGLETGTRGSINTEILERAGGVNVVDQPGRRGVTRVSLEQVLAWNPAFIVTQDDRFIAHAKSDPTWAGVAAVRDGGILRAPSMPFGWVDSPPGVNRLIGLRWLASKLHPGQIRLDERAEAKRFHQLLYGVDLDDRQLDALLGGRPERG